MSLYIACPRRACEGEIEFEIATDSDDYRTFVFAEPTTGKCSEEHEITADEWDIISPKADKIAQDEYYNVGT